MADTSVAARIGVLSGVIEFESAVTHAALAKPRSNAHETILANRAALLHRARESLARAAHFLEAHDQEQARRHWRSTLAVMAEVFRINVG